MDAVAFEDLNVNYSSQECAACGHVSADNRPTSQAVFLCVACGNKDNADDNAAKVLKKRTMANLASQAVVSMGRRADQGGPASGNCRRSAREGAFFTSSTDVWHSC